MLGRNAWKSSGLSNPQSASRNYSAIDCLDGFFRLFWAFKIDEAIMVVPGPFSCGQVRSYSFAYCDASEFI